MQRREEQLQAALPGGIVRMQPPPAAAAAHLSHLIVCCLDGSAKPSCYIDCFYRSNVRIRTDKPKGKKRDDVQARLAHERIGSWSKCRGVR